MNPKLDVSVIIPTYNRLPMLKEALQSVFSQDFNGSIEVIVVDDNSSDGTAEFITQQYAEVHLIKLEKNVGCPAARNRGIKVARGKYIAPLDSDDFWEKNYLETQINTLAQKEKSFAVSDLLFWNAIKNAKKVRLQRPDLNKYNSPLHHLLVGSFIYTPSSVVFPKQLFSEIGYFDDKIKYGSDTDFYIRSLLAGYQPIFTEFPLVIQRKHGKEQMTNIKNLKNRIRDRFFYVDNLYPQVEKQLDAVSLKRIHAEIYADYAKQYFKRKSLLNWLRSSLNSASHSSLSYALSNMANDLREALIKKNKLPEQ
ncbi:glycosyltransferase family 2 protein [Capilliphycus salinus ALCB114379]|uniref:glycosyltransferase family 2 protein n=1 Tax=Capilliphycus salinus TaxID=2768948 RepID=UPI0039A66D55